MRFTHVINPYLPPAGSEHAIAFRVTYASLSNALAAAAKENLPVEVLAAAYQEDASAISPPARATPPLDVSVLDFARFEKPRKFPLLKDILQRAHAHGTGEYLIYTNMDIALQRHFYVAVDAMIRAAPAPFAAAINRRTISKSFEHPDQIEQMYAQPGSPHPGFDCFVFPRDWVPKLSLGNVCIGTRHFDGLLAGNLDLLSGFQFQIFRDLHLTFHLGDDLTWMSRPDYDEFNLLETICQFEIMRQHCPHPQAVFGFLCSGYLKEKSILRTLHRRAKRWPWLRSLLTRVGYLKAPAAA